MSQTIPNRVLIAMFLAMLSAPLLVQTVTETRRGENPAALQIFRQSPTPENLRAYDKSLENDSVTARALRPWMQAAQFFALDEAGEKAFVGRDDWLFYQPGVSFLTQRPQPLDSNPRNALAAVVNFHDALAARGIQLVLLPVPNKESVYPDKLSRHAAPPARIISAETRAFFAGCLTAGVEVVDLFALNRAARDRPGTELYLHQDSHWSPAGAKLAAAAVAERILSRGWLTRGEVDFTRRTNLVQRRGDIVRMLRSPEIETRLSPETIACEQVIRHDTGKLYTNAPASEVLVLGDSFLRIYEHDEPRGAGFSAHLARALGRPLASIVNDGGASTLVRQELFRRPQLLATAKVVVWEFVERDLRLGTEGWQLVPLPKP